jgi:hypothetical protein
MNHREETLQRTNPAVRDLSYPAERAAKKLIIPNEISLSLSLSLSLSFSLALSILPPRHSPDTTLILSLVLPLRAVLARTHTRQRITLLFCSAAAKIVRRAERCVCSSGPETVERLRRNSYLPSRFLEDIRPAVESARGLT